MVRVWNRLLVGELADKQAVPSKLPTNEQYRINERS
jgi:hypothetical protein